MKIQVLGAPSQWSSKFEKMMSASSKLDERATTKDAVAIVQFKNLKFKEAPASPSQLPRLLVGDFSLEEIASESKKGRILGVYQNLEVEEAIAILTSNDVISAPARKRKKSVDKQIEALRAGLIAVHQANSIAEVERLLLAALRIPMQLEWVRILFSHHESLERAMVDNHQLSTIMAPLYISGSVSGKIVFARSAKQIFRKSENDFLKQIADGVAIALDRLRKLEQAEVLKQQWESTFDAISDPLCIANHEFKIVRTNSAFATTTGMDIKKLPGLNCFEAFVGRKRGAVVIPTETSFRVQRVSVEDSSVLTFEVTTQKIKVNDDSPELLLIFFRDVTSQIKIEKQILESSKMAELGTIGSSIAHELNNPLGGMLNFLQLIAMDLPKSDPRHEDIVEMQRAGNRCKEIIENLLGFSRRSGARAVDSEKEKMDLKLVLKQPISIIELQARSLGVAVNLDLPVEPVIYFGHPELLSQAVSHVLQNAFEAVSEKLAQNPRFKGQIDVILKRSEQSIEIRIVDNGIGIDPDVQNKIINPLFTTKAHERKRGLGLTIAYNIVDSHGGTLEISSQMNVGTTVKIALHEV